MSVQEKNHLLLCLENLTSKNLTGKISRSIGEKERGDGKIRIKTVCQKASLEGHALSI